MKHFIFICMMLTIGFSKPFTPKDLNQVILTLDESAEHQKISSLLIKLEKDKNNVELLDELVTLYTKLAKEKSDGSYMGYAKAILLPYLDRYPDSYILRMHYIDILQYTHHFDEALEELSKVQKTDLKNPQPFVIEASIYQAKGDFSQALQVCKQLLFRGSSLLSATCITTMQSNLGKVEQNYKVLKETYEKSDNAEKSERSWALISLADMAYRLNRKEEAMAYLDDALGLNKNDYYARKKLAEIYIEDKKYEEAEALLEPYTFVDALLIRLSVAQQSLNKDIKLGKATLISQLKVLKMRNEKPHAEDIEWLKRLGIQ
jgi:tetratricopeptide (TPR) repeat protein